MNQFDDIRRIAVAIKFKEYLLNRDVSSRRIVIDYCIEKLGLLNGIRNWFLNLRAINDQIDAKDRKEQIRMDAFWDDLILVHSKDGSFRVYMELFVKTPV